MPRCAVLGCVLAAWPRLPQHPTVSHGVPQCPMVSHSILRCPTVSHGVPQHPMVSQCPMVSHSVLRRRHHSASLRAMWRPPVSPHGPQYLLLSTLFHISSQPSAGVGSNVISLVTGGAERLP